MQRSVDAPPNNLNCKEVMKLLSYCGRLIIQPWRRTVMPAGIKQVQNNTVMLEVIAYALQK
jgi:hypothetical protein